MRERRREGAGPGGPGPASWTFRLRDWRRRSRAAGSAPGASAEQERYYNLSAREYERPPNNRFIDVCRGVSAGMSRERRPSANLDTVSFIQSLVSGRCACTAVLDCRVTLGTRLSRFSGFRQKHVRVRACLCAHQPGHPPQCLFCGVFTVTFAYRKKGFRGCDFAMLIRSSDGLTGSLTGWLTG